MEFAAAHSETWEQINWLGVLSYKLPSQKLTLTLLRQTRGKHITCVRLGSVCFSILSMLVFIFDRFRSQKTGIRMEKGNLSSDKKMSPRLKRGRVLRKCPQNLCVCKDEVSSICLSPFEKYGLNDTLVRRS